jgi:hypothetical protein
MKFSIGGQVGVCKESPTLAGNKMPMSGKVLHSIYIPNSVKTLCQIEQEMGVRVTMCLFVSV